MWRSRRRISWSRTSCKRGFEKLRRLRFELAQNVGGLNGSMQHWLGVYSPEFQSPRFFADVDLGAALPCRDRLENSRTSRFFWGSIVAADRWCFRLWLAARGSADYRGRLSPWWPRCSSR